MTRHQKVKLRDRLWLRHCGEARRHGRGHPDVLNSFMEWFVADQDLREFDNHTGIYAR